MNSQVYFKYGLICIHPSWATSTFSKDGSGYMMKVNMVSACLATHTSCALDKGVWEPTL